MTAYDVQPGAPTDPKLLERPQPEHLEEPRPVEIPADMRAPAPAVPSTGPMPKVASSAPPATPGTPPVRPMSYFADIDHYSKHPDPVDGGHTCPSGSAYRHPNPAYCHPWADTTAFGYSIPLEHDIPISSEPTDPSQGPPLAEQMVPPKETTTGEIEASIPSIQTSTTDPSSPHDPPTTI
ncbi:hypothetical protein CK203_114998 [Vitis vinifera]|uniref:Uncharacterized protein n=1 Tax=Vitis vinifera TaxID=29760 RepID=A0A438CE52_VITVI|nr:hypothetical protein CK203_114998 [Vitis vinifera]